MKAAPNTPPLASATALQLLGVEKSFGAGDTVTRALRHTDFEARRGELLLLVGPSGCGKTTLLSILAGTLLADAGEVNVLGHALHTLSESERTRFRSRHLGFIFQQFNLIPTLSVAENVAVPLLIQGLSLDAALARARAILEVVGLGNRFAEAPNKLSGGQQQRIAIARALVHEPPLIVCDEPTSALDRENGHLVMDLLRNVARDPNRTVIVVTHDPRIYHFGDRMAEMEDGRIFKTLQSNAEILAAHAAG
ncbi:ABC transporter ATP-binding protein [Nibricoccus sp. IMCC34717]|uniref:ABC transporter ATP-binding protein n=1 Tax=Nibricoccus sp. IMCC34717 TaxID=3034021 RepID=UPI003850BC21